MVEGQGIPDPSRSDSQSLRERIVSLETSLHESREAQGSMTSQLEVLRREKGAAEAEAQRLGEKVEAQLEQLEKQKQEGKQVGQGRHGSY